MRWEAQGGGPVPDAAVASLSDLGDRLRSAVGSQPSQFLRRQMLVALVWAVQALPTTRTVTKAAIHVRSLPVEAWAQPPPSLSHACDAAVACRSTWHTCAPSRFLGLAPT